MTDDNDYNPLIKQAQDGDSRAFETLVTAHYHMMFKFSYTWCGNQRDAEDICQDACIKLARGIGSFQFKSAFSSWLYMLVINAGKDFYRKSNRQPVSSDGLERISQDAKAENTVYARQVLQAVHGLPEGEKDALLLVVDQGLSHKEAATLLDVKESTISWRIHEARKKLNAIFGKEAAHG